MADFSIAKDCEIKFQAEKVWKDSQNQTEQYTADAETIKALAMKQKDRTQIISQLEDPSLEDDTIRVVWLDNCGETVSETCQNVCDFTASELAMASKTFQLNQCVSDSFSINENDLRKSMYSFEELVALKLLSVTKALDENLNKKALLFLTANAGYNSNPESYTVTGSTLEIPTAEYNVDLYVKMALDGKLNKMTDAFVVDSGSLWKPFFKAELERGDSDGPGAFAKKNVFDTYFDLVGFPSAPITDSSFLISPSAYAFASRAYQPNNPIEVNPKDGRQIRWSIQSNNIPGVRYDVYHEYACSGRRFTHKYYIEANVGFVLNPEGCDITLPGPTTVNRSGILSYTKVA